MNRVVKYDIADKKVNSALISDRIEIDGRKRHIALHPKILIMMLIVFINEVFD